MMTPPTTSATPRARPRSTLSVAAIVAAAAGLGASLASWIDYARPSPTFCAETGCATVRESAWSHPLGIPMPLFGVVFFAAALAFGFIDAPRLRRALAAGGAAVAITLLVVQGAVIGAWCKLCVVTDVASLGYAALVLAGAGALRFTLARGIAVAPAIAATLGLLAITSAPTAPPQTLSPSPVAPGVAPIAGVTTVVEFIDFECPFCRRFHERLTAAMAQAKTPVRIVRKMLPLAMHPRAMPAAIAYCCAEAQGKGEEMAAALFAADPEELTPEGCEQIAQRIGCDLERYRRDKPAAEQRIAADMAEAKAAGIRSLPTVFIGDHKIIGAGNTSEQLLAMIETARR